LPLAGVDKEFFEVRQPSCRFSLQRKSQEKRSPASGRKRKRKLSLVHPKKKGTLFNTLSGLTSEIQAPANVPDN
jgi:hypothetical protein